MTSQTKKFIELSDLLGLHFRCNKCDASLFLSGTANTRI